MMSIILSRARSLFKDFLHIFYHELLYIFHDPGILIFIVFVPLAYPLLYSWVYTSEIVRKVPAVVVDDCNSKRSGEFIRKVDASPDVRIVGKCVSMEEARHYVQSHNAYGIYHIPSGFDSDLWKLRQTVVGLYCDMSSMLYYKALLMSATEVSLAINQDIKIQRMGVITNRDEEIARQPVEYEHVKMYNPSGGFASFLIPPVLMLILQHTLLLGIGMQMGGTRERNHGFIIPSNRYYSNPVVIVAGKAFVYFGIYLIMGIYAFTCVSKWFQLPVAGNYTTLLGFLVPYLLACIFFATTLSSLIYRREDCILLFVFLSVPLLFLSGMSWPGVSIPAFWKCVSWMFPSTFGTNGYVRIATMGCSLAEIRVEWLALWIQAIIYFIATIIIYSRQMADKSRPLV